MEARNTQKILTGERDAGQLIARIYQHPWKAILSQQSIQKMMKQAIGKQPLRRATDDVSSASWASSS